MGKPNLHADIRWPAFKDQYGADLCAFAAEVCGAELNADTRAVYLSASKPSTRMVLSEVANKSSARLAAVALWAMLFHARNEVVVIAPRCVVHKHHWAIYKQVLAGTHSWLGEYLLLSQAGLRTHAGYAGPRIYFRTAINCAPENLAGIYGNQVLLLVEGALGIGDNCMQVLRASIDGPVISKVLALSGLTIVQTTQ